MKIIFWGGIMNNFDKSSLIKVLKINNLIKLLELGTIIFGEFFDKGLELQKIINNYLENIDSLENIEINSSLVDELNIANLILLVKNPMELDETKIYFIKKKLYDYTINSIEEFKNLYSNKTM